MLHVELTQAEKIRRSTTLVFSNQEAWCGRCLRSALPSDRQCNGCGVRFRRKAAASSGNRLYYQQHDLIEIAYDPYIFGQPI